MQSNNKPLISILIPVYNGSNYLAEAIQSALHQTYHNLEIVVINDGSTDGGKTRKLAQEFRDKIRYFEKQNGGVASALNFGIQKMRGEYFSWLSHDDQYFPEKIAYEFDRLTKFGEKSIIYSNFQQIDESGKLLSNIFVGDIQPSMIRYAFATRNFLLNGCTLLIPKNAFVKHSFNEKLRTTQDYDLWFDLAIEYEFRYLDETLVKSRVHSEQDSRKLAIVVVDEGENLQKSFLDRIARSEIETEFHSSEVRFYFGCWYWLLLRGFVQSAEYSLEKLRSSVPDKSILLLLITCLKIIQKMVQLARKVNHAR